MRVYNNLSPRTPEQGESLYEQSTYCMLVIKGLLQIFLYTCPAALDIRDIRQNNIHSENNLQNKIK